MPSCNVVGIVAGASSALGGVERHILSLIRGSDPRRFRFVVFCPHALLAAVEDLGLGNAEAVEWAPRSAQSVCAVIRLRSLLRDRNVSLLHIHDPRSGVAGRLVAKALRIPVVYTVHLPPYHYTTGVKRRMYRRIEGFLNWRFTDRIVYVSHQAHNEAISLHVAPRSRSVVIENGIDLGPYNRLVDRRAVREAVSCPHDATVLCFVGRFTEQKGIDLLLQAVKALHDQRTDFKLWLVGDGPLRAQLEQYVLKGGLASKVQFLGFRKDVPTLLGASDVFVLPSRLEAMPVSLLEAMASGLPCVVTSVGDNAKLVEDGITGLVVPPEDAGALATALGQVLADPGLRCSMGEAAHRKAQQYTVERMGARTLAIYEELLAERS